MKKYFFILFATLFVVSGCQNQKLKHPGDTEIIGLFTTNRVAFGSLVEILQTDTKVEYCEFRNGAVRLNGGHSVNDERIGEYEKHFKGIGQPMVVHSHAGGIQVWFQLSSSGTTVAGSSKGIAFEGDAPKVIVSDTDKQQMAEDTMVFRSIDGKWFVYRSQ